MFIECSQKKVRPPSGGLCLHMDGTHLIGQRHCPPDGGRAFDAVKSIDIALLTEGELATDRLIP